MAVNQDLAPPITPTEAEESAVDESLKKTSASGKQLYLLKYLPEIESNNLKELQKEAYHCVLRAFVAESTTMSSTKIMILNDLRTELKFAYATHASLLGRVMSDPLIRQLSGSSPLSDEEMDDEEEDNELEEWWEEGEDGEEWEEEETAIEKPNISRKPQAEGTTTPVDLEGKAIQSSSSSLSWSSRTSPELSWGQVSPGSLIGRRLRIKLPGQNDYTVFTISEYDEKKGMHRLASTMDPKDPFNWIDLRHIPREDIQWHQVDPGLPTRAYSLKPGETFLRTTSTTLNKKRHKQFGKTITGIPIIGKGDKGKSIA